MARNISGWSGPSRRTVLKHAAMGIAAGTFVRCPAAGAASIHEFNIGAIQITILSDGNLVMPTPFLATNIAPDVLRSTIAPNGQFGERVEPPCNVTIVKTAADVVLIDAGAGPHFMPTAGKLMASLEAARISPKSITKVVYTHAHPDHLWGTLDDFDDSPNFPNASYVIGAAEWNFWAKDDAITRLPDDRKFFAAPTRRILTAIKERITTIAPGQEIAAGLRAIDTAGHTVGHIAIEVASGNDTLLVLGDALTHPFISFEHPDWRPAADHHDAEQAVRTRRSLLDRLAADRTRIVGFHLPYPGTGRVSRHGTTFRYVAEGS